ncbi:glycerol-3-phosphate dehydrogenase/oxidase [Poriferisphaera sp. WC338]|uniref:glycerol-3-phosphate dehydrogenase/oxidase n=1 Tax=Poriferisphaera sp. WC338 TaxID=3425129 RepID=UPI003D81558D
MNQIEAKRNKTITRLGEDLYDVVVIGGGIVGAGVARDAAMRGLRVAVIEKHDVAFGTSSRSTRLLHGGIRYLQQYRVGLVREASVEKCTVGRIAPHLAHGLRFVYPVYKHHPYKMWQMRIGVKIYDLLCSGNNFGKSEAGNVQKTKGWVPPLATKGLSGAVRYFDGLTNDSRLVIDSLRSARAYGADVLNYAEVLRSDREGDVWQVRVKDHIGGEEMMVRGRTVVNATGPWSMDFEQCAIKLRPSKGVHLVIEKEKLPIEDAVVITEGRRILFAIPWGACVILGTTDTDFVGRSEDVRTEQEDVRYILDAANTGFEGLGLTEVDVISHWVGLRPLIADPNGKPSDISRKHLIVNSHEGWWDVGGGKLTTYRLMAEQAVDQIGKYLGMRMEACRTDEEGLLALGLEDRYSGILPPAVSQEAVAYYCEEEWARSLMDVMSRRSSWQYYHRDDMTIAEKVSKWMAGILGWDEADRKRQVTMYAASNEIADMEEGDGPKEVGEAKGKEDAAA